MMNFNNKSAFKRHKQIIYNSTVKTMKERRHQRIIGNQLKNRILKDFLKKKQYAYLFI